MATFRDDRVTDTVVIDFSDPLAPIPWASFADGVAQGNGVVDELSGIAELALNKTLIVWVSGEKVNLSSVTVPSGQQRHLRQILPSLLEDNLASDIDDLHFAIGSISSEGQVNLAVLDRSVLEHDLELLNDAGLKPQTLLPDSLAVPLVNGAWSLQVEGEISYLRTAAQMSYVIDTQNLPVLLPMFKQADSQPLSLYIADNQRDSVSVDYDTEWRGQPVDILSSLPEKSVLAMNLLQGEFKPQSNMKKQWLQWRNVAFLAAAALFIQLTNVGLETWQLNQQAMEYKSEVKAVFKSTFPDEKRLVNPKAQMTQRLAKLQSQQDSTGFLMLLQQMAPALKQSTLVSMTRINFERRLGELRVDIKAQDYAQLEALKNAITKLDLKVELGSVSGSQGAYTARLMIRSQQ